MDSQENPKILAIIGPTAVGKTSLAITLAKKYDGEIISVDSRQVYKTLDIGTEKITEEEMQGVPHYLIDICEPEEVMTAQQFQKIAREKIEDILKRNKTPILAGGTGMYLESTLYDITFPEVPPNASLREELEQLSTEKLFEKLKEEDPDRAKTADAHNRRRLIRALEIIDAIGAVPPPKKGPLLYDALILGLSIERDELRERITKRLDQALARGLIEEITLVRDRVGEERAKEFGLEYAIGISFLNNHLSEPEMREKMVTELMRYAKRQMTFLKRNNDIVWVSDPEEAEQKADLFLNAN